MAYFLDRLVQGLCLHSARRQPYTEFKHLRNILIVFLISGLWHGSNWTFVIWGLYHGLLFIATILLFKKRHKDTVAANRLFPSLKETLQMILTFALVTVGWIFFRADTISDAFNYIGGMCSIEVFQAIPRFFTEPGMRLAALLTAMMVGIEWLNRKYDSPLEISNRLVKPLRYAVYLFLAFCIFWHYNNVNTFIYAQF